MSPRWKSLSLSLYAASSLARKKSKRYTVGIYIYIRIYVEKRQRDISIRETERRRGGHMRVCVHVCIHVRLTQELRKSGISSGSPDHRAAAGYRAAAAAAAENVVPNVRRTVSSLGDLNAWIRSRPGALAAYCPSRKRRASLVVSLDTLPLAAPHSVCIAEGTYIYRYIYCGRKLMGFWGPDVYRHHGPVSVFLLFSRSSFSSRRRRPTNEDAFFSLVFRGAQGISEQVMSLFADKYIVYRLSMLS